MHQKKYTLDVLKRFNMLNYNATITLVDIKSKLKKEKRTNLVDPTIFKQMVGCSRYLCNTRIDISYNVGLVSKLWRNLNMLIF